MSFPLLFLAACTGTGGTGGGEVADYRLTLVPITPPDVNPFEGADRIDLLLDDGVGEPKRVALDVPGSGDSAIAEQLPALDNTRVIVEVFADGELVGWGQSLPLTTSTGDVEAAVLVATPDSAARLGGLPDEFALGQGAPLGDGRFVLMGGTGNRSTKKPERTLDTVWTLDLGNPDAALAFSEVGSMPEYVDASGDTTTERRDFTLTRLTAGDAGKYLLVGGTSAVPYQDGTVITSDCRLFDPETLSFGEAFPSRDSLYTARAAHAAIANQQGGVLVWGGYGAAPEGRFIDLQDGELYDPVSRSFTPVEGPRDGGEHLGGSIAVGLAPIGNDGILVAGGMHTDSTGDWLVTGMSFSVSFSGTVEEFGEMSGVAAHALLALDGGDAIAFGGVEDDGNTHTYGESLPASTLVQRFDAGSGTWESVGQMALARAGHTATLLDSRYVLIAGGAGDWGPLGYPDSAYSCLELYDLERDRSAMVGDCSASDDAGGLAARAQFPTALFDPEYGVLFAGGVDGASGAHATTAFYALPRSD
jgi:hypothetical protein